MRTRNPVVYIMASGFHGTLYVGVTSEPMRRIAQHRDGTLAGFTAEHAFKRLVWFEMHATMPAAITREKQLKNWRREWKLALIEAENPAWRDLAEEFGFEPLVKKKVDPGSSPGRRFPFFVMLNSIQHPLSSFSTVARKVDPGSSPG